MPKEMHEKSLFQRLHFNENPNVGVFCRANDNIAFIRRKLSKGIKKKIISTLDVELIELNIADASIIGALLAFNSNGAVVADFIDNDAVKRINNLDLMFTLLLINLMLLVMIS